MFKKVTTISLIFIPIFLFSGIFAQLFLTDSSAVSGEAGVIDPVVLPITVEEEEEGKVMITISAIGDCALGVEYAQQGHTLSSVLAENNGNSSYFFANVKGVLAEDDLTIANLETCLTKAIQRKNKSYEKVAYWLKGEPHYTEILTQGSVEVVNIANNHILDYGEEGYTETLASLEKAGIDYCGFDQVLIKEIKGIKLGFLGFSQFGNKGLWQSFTSLKEQVATAIQDLQEQTDLIVVSFHWGNEREIKPSAKQYELAKLAIDSGADLVLGHHPHVLQGIKEYQGKPVVFSLGNFCFGANRYPYDRDTMIYQQTFTFNTGELVSTSSKVIPCSMTTKPGLNDFQPKLLEGTEAERVLEKLKKRSEMIIFEVEMNKTQ